MVYIMYAMPMVKCDIEFHYIHVPLGIINVKLKSRDQSPPHSNME